jgi:hypothetical protein
MGLKLAHIINPVKVSSSSDLFIAQPVTFESMRVAKNNSRDDISVSLFSQQYAEDRSIVPAYIQLLPDLEKSILDVGTFTQKRKLPLIADLIQSEVVLDLDFDYLIYTNVDIAVQPHFYNWIADRISEGLDSFIVNRRTITAAYKDPKELHKMYLEKGEAHPGYDCFIISKALIPKMYLANICIGAANIGLALYLNLRLFAKNFKEFGDEFLTFHIGNDQVWKHNSNNEFKLHNQSEFERVKTRFKSDAARVELIIQEAFPTLRSRAQPVPSKNGPSVLSRLLNRLRK